MLEYALYPNELTKDDPDDQVARPVDVVTKRMEDLIEQMTIPGSILKTTEIKAVLDAYWDTIRGFIKEGEAYSDDYLSIRFAIGGVFVNEEDRFDPERHELYVVPKIKSSVTEAVSEVTLKKVDAKKNLPVIDSIYDWGTDSKNRKITPGDVLEVEGSLLKIEDNLPEEGIFFVNVADASETKVALIRKNSPSTLTFKIPALAAGNYQLEVRNTRSQGGKSLRSGIFAPMLLVE